VEVAFEVGQDGIELTYEDAAPPYDPFAALSPPDEGAAVVIAEIDTERADRPALQDKRNTHVCKFLFVQIPLAGAI